MRHAIAFVLLNALLASAALADDDGDRSQGGERRGPPEAALAACSAAVQGDPCSFQGRHEESLDGTCEAPEGKPLACRPSDAPQMEFRERQ